MRHEAAAQYAICHLRGHLPLAGGRKRTGQPGQGGRRPLPAPHAAIHRQLFLFRRVPRADGQVRRGRDRAGLLLSQRAIPRPGLRGKQRQCPAPPGAIPHCRRPGPQLRDRAHDDFRQAVQRRSQHPAHPAGSRPARAGLRAGRGRSRSPCNASANSGRCGSGCTSGPGGRCGCGLFRRIRPYAPQPERGVLFPRPQPPPAARSGECHAVFFLRGGGRWRWI